MMKKIKENGGLIAQYKVESLSELSGYDIVINCTGLGSRELVTNTLPVQGQIVVVRAPWMKTIHYNGEHDLSNIAYILPYKDVVLLCGTSDPLNWSTTPDPKTAEAIYKKCLELVPELKGAEVIGGWACLRPIRYRVRLELENHPNSPMVIHNYGHGGHGIILSWGCALDTVELVQECLEKRGFTLQTMN